MIRMRCLSLLWTCSFSIIGAVTCICLLPWPIPTSPGDLVVLSMAGIWLLLPYYLGAEASRWYANQRGPTNVLRLGMVCTILFEISVKAPVLSRALQGAGGGLDFCSSLVLFFVLPFVQVAIVGGAMAVASALSTGQQVQGSTQD